MKKYLTPAVRRWVYGVAIAALPLLIYFGLVEPEAAPLWVAFIIAFLNVQDDDGRKGPALDGREVHAALLRLKRQEGRKLGLD